MTQGAGTRRQQEHVHGSPPNWIELHAPLHPPPHAPPLHTPPLHARLSWASVALLLALLSDQLWFRAEAKAARDKLSPVPPPPLSPAVSPLSTQSPEHRAAFMDNSSTPRCDRFEDRDSSEDEDMSPSLTFSDAELVCGNISEVSRSSWSVDVSGLYLSFCSSYSLFDLLRGASRPDRLNCSLAALSRGHDPEGTCSACVSAFQRYDLHALEKYEEFEMLALKYEPGPYSVRSCMDQCKMAYKWWLCAQFFPHTAPSCPQTVPCVQSCLQVQQSCPYILPDNEDLIHGGSPSFICTGLVSSGGGEFDSEARCCDVRWDSSLSSSSPPSPRGTVKRTASPSSPCQQQQGAPVSSASYPRLRLCPLLALVLLHTVLLFSHNATLSEEGSSNED